MLHERKQILEMLADGKISSEEAERLLDKIGNSTGGTAAATSTEVTLADGTTKEGESTERAEGVFGKKRLKYLRVVVNSNDGDKVNVRVPLALVRTGIKLSTMLPSEANERLSEKGIDLSRFGEMEGEELVEALRDLSVDVDSSDGDTVRIFSE